jgi:hypothetical protein
LKVFSNFRKPFALTGFPTDKSTKRKTMETSFVRVAFKTVLVLAFAAFSANAQIVVDNSDPGFSASAAWGTAWGGGSYGPNSRYRATAPVSDPATWKVNLPSTAPYGIYAWWVSAVNRSKTAPYIVYHAAGSTTVVVNQQLNGSRWNYLGTWSNPYQVKLSPWTATGYIVSADAIMWR